LARKVFDFLCDSVGKENAEDDSDDSFCANLIKSKGEWGIRVCKTFIACRYVVLLCYSAPVSTLIETLLVVISLRPQSTFTTRIMESSSFQSGPTDSRLTESACEAKESLKTRPPKRKGPNILLSCQKSFECKSFDMEGGQFQEISRGFEYDSSSSLLVLYLPANSVRQKVSCRVSSVPYGILLERAGIG
jgi:hypothetical protein